MQITEYAKKYVNDEFSKKRRLNVVDKMAGLTSAGANCFSCTGVCCTFVGNSMMVTPLEALELVFYLDKKGEWAEGLLERLNETISIFRLDREVPSDGRRSFARRRYTCPFFVEGAGGGCTVRKRFKPYGCLGFNAMGPSVKDGENCKSYLDVLESRDEEHQDVESLFNQKIKLELDLDWDKKNMPSALKELYEICI